MDESSEILDPVTLSSETSQDEPAEKADLPTASTTAPETLESEITTLTEACKLAQGEPQHQFTNRFLQLIHETEFEFGFSNPADSYVREALDTYGPFAREWVNEVFLNNINDPFVTCSILRVIAHFDYLQMSPQGSTMVAACVALYTDADVLECCVRCFESWASPKTLPILERISFSKDWLNEYLANVISYLEELPNHAVCR